MAGMFDFFAGPQAQGMSPEARQGIGQQSMLALASALLQAGGPSTRPVSFGQALGSALPGMIQAQQQGADRAQRQSIFDLQTKGLKRADAQDERLDMARQRYQNAVSQGGTDMGRPVDMKRLLMDAYPEQAASMAFTAMAPKPLQKVGEGETLYDPNTKKSIFSGQPKADEFTRKVSALTGQGYDPKTALNMVLRPPPPGYTYGENGALVGDPNYLNDQMRLRAAGANRVDINQTQERAESSGYGGQLIKEYSTIADTASTAEQARNQLRIVRAQVDPADPAALPSALQQKAGNAAVALGMNPDNPTIKAMLGNVTNGQAFNGMMQNLVLTKMQAQKGPQTENDAKRIESTVASLGNTPAARDFLMRAADSLAYEDMLKRQFWDDYRAEKNTFDGAQVAWRKFKNDVPLVGKNPQTGAPIFFSEFAEANRGKPYAEIVKKWSTDLAR